MKIWKENYRAWEGRKFDGMRHRPWQYSVAQQPDDVLFVRVCSFTFVFFSVEGIEEYLDYYSKKIHPSSAKSDLNVGHWERQNKFDELPLYLREEPKRIQVVKALSAAIAQFVK